MEAQGYAKLAGYMGQQPDLLILRRFSALNAQNLLYLQAELVTLEENLHRYASEDHGRAALGNVECEVLARDYRVLISARSRQQWRTMVRIRKVLREYNQALQDKSQLETLHIPTSRELDRLKDWHLRASPDNRDVTLNIPGGEFPGLESTLLGPDARIFEQDTVEDLIVAKTHVDVDTISALVTRLTNKLFDIFRGSRDRDLHVVQIVFSGSLRLLDAVDWILRTAALVVFALLPIAAIVVLYVVTDTVQRLGVIASFTAGFSMLIRLASSKVSTIEVFAATAAFAAVQIVFINPRLNG